jgi:type IV pilus assembly protein PilW
MMKKNKPEYTKSGKRFQGFTLIELLVGMMLSLFLIGGIVTVYIGSKKGYQSREELSALEDNGRVAIQALVSHLEHTGYAGADPLYINSHFITAADRPIDGLCAAPGGSNITISDTDLLLNTTDGANASDTIGLVSVADTVINTDCTGQEIRDECKAGNAVNSVGTLIYNSFYVQQAAGEEPRLMCAGSVGADPVVLAEGVEEIQFLYGVDTDQDKRHNQYFSAAQLNAGVASWGNVVSVKVAILIRSINQIKPASMPASYQLLDRVVATNDRYHRAVFSAEVPLRNAQL